MARGGYRPGAGRPRKPAGTQQPKSKLSSRRNLTPLEHMLRIMNDTKASPERRDRMAIAAAPYVHVRAAEQKPGKKALVEQAAAAAATESSDSGDDLVPRALIN
jgi:hypothetical protein